MLKWNPVDRWTDFQKCKLLGLQHDAFIAEKKRHVVALLEAGADVNAANGEAFLLQQFSKQAWDTCPYYCKSSS